MIQVLLTVDCQSAAMCTEAFFLGFRVTLGFSVTLGFRVTLGFWATWSPRVLSTRLVTIALQSLKPGGS